MAGGKDNEFEETSGGESDGDDGSLFDFDAGQLRVPPSVLCAKCQFICDSWSLVLSRTLEDDHIDFPHCDSSAALEASAKRGCSLCAQFLASVDQERQKIVGKDVRRNRTMVLVILAVALKFKMLCSTERKSIPFTESIAGYCTYPSAMGCGTFL